MGPWTTFPAPGKRRRQQGHNDMRKVSNWIAGAVRIMHREVSLLRKVRLEAEALGLHGPCLKVRPANAGPSCVEAQANLVLLASKKDVVGMQAELSTQDAPVCTNLVKLGKTHLDDCAACLNPPALVDDEQDAYMEEGPRNVMEFFPGLLCPSDADRVRDARNAYGTPVVHEQLTPMSMTEEGDIGRQVDAKMCTVVRDAAAATIEASNAQTDTLSAAWKEASAAGTYEPTWNCWLTIEDLMRLSVTSRRHLDIAGILVTNNRCSVDEDVDDFASDNVLDIPFVEEAGAPGEAPWHDADEEDAYWLQLAERYGYHDEGVIENG